MNSRTEFQLAHHQIPNGSRAVGLRLNDAYRMLPGTLLSMSPVFIALNPPNNLRTQRQLLSHLHTDEEMEVVRDERIHGNSYG